jgi:hypothetical protein
MALAGITLFTAVAAIAAAPLAAWAGGMAALRWVMLAVVLLAIANLGQAWFLPDGQPRAYAIVLASFTFVAGFCSATLSGIALARFRSGARIKAGE